MGVPQGMNFAGLAFLFIGMVSVVIVVFWGLWQHFLLPKIPADACTRCGRGIIARVNAGADGRRFYQCESCGARYLRESRSGPWLDAARPEHEAMFCPRRSNATTGKMEQPVEQLIYWTRTVDVLLRNKRTRETNRKARNASTRKLPYSIKWISPRFQASRDASGLWDRDMDG
jgi:hypothetical protein